MLRYALFAVAAATVVAVVFVMLPTGGGPRPEPHILASGDTAPSTSFVIHPAAPPAPDTPAASATPPAATPGDLDAVMQRLRAGSASPATTPATTAPAVPGTPAATVSAGPATTTLSSTTTASTTTDPAAPQVAPAPSPPATDPAPTPPPAPKWASVTAQGTRWRMARSSDGYIVSIDLGGGQVADVHVLPAFGALDQAAVNVRVDYLRDTIVQNFSHHSASYSFARDGSVSVVQ